MSHYVLGLSCFYHDSAAALLKDGVVVAAAEEERFSREKHSNKFPALAVRYCLDEAGIDLRDVAYVAFYEKPLRKFHRILESFLATWPSAFVPFRTAIPLWLGNRLHIDRTVRRTLKLPARQAILYGDHHVSHAASAFLVSPFEKAAILTLDGVGEWTTAAYGYGEGTQFTLEREIRFPHSLGLFYSAVTAYLGFRVNDAEWKVMGLAAYGQPRFLDQMRRLIDVQEDGGFRLDLDYFTHHTGGGKTYSARWQRLFGRPGRRPDEPLEGFHEDVAASGQRRTEEVILAIARALSKKYRCPNLVIAGGVGLNSVANGKILAETDFERLFVQPAAGDDGAALGVAHYVWNTVLGQPRAYEMRHAQLGPGYSDDAIARALDRAGARYVRFDDEDALLDRTVALLARRRVIGWFQGRMEFGPRALGGRSILGDPRDAEMKDLINAKIKFRERFRPFAPSVLRERVGEFFDLDADSPFMLLVAKVKPHAAALLPAVTHADGTGRVQTVTRDVNPRYYRLLERWGAASGVPVLINTSFNVRGEPIVCTPDDAWQCYQKTGLDALIIGNCLLEKDAPVAVAITLGADQHTLRLD